MAVLTFVLVLIASVLVSTLFAQMMPRISVSLIQIGIGVLVALFVQIPVDVNLDPDVFLILFIAPLLFNEAKNLDRLGFWQNKGMILSLALGLVAATTAAVGFGLSAVMPVLPLAAALALGAALGPTDAVAVSSMSKVAKLSQKQKSILSGECLINDASGLVAFQFAIGLALTGEVALAEAGLDFLKEFVGGIALGCVIGWMCNVIVGFTRNQGLEDRKFHVLFELTLPFLTYIIADTLHVSGVLAVVACGVVFSLAYNQAGIDSSKMNIVSSSVWDVMAFALNGIVFVLLGMMLPDSVFVHLDDVSTINWNLIGCSILVAAIVVACRFLWVLAIDRIFGDADEIDKGLIKHAAVISCAGPKGAITLSIAMTIPYTFVMRNEMIFMASIVILITLLIANFAVPLLTPAPEDDIDERMKNEYKVYMKVLRQVIEKLTEDAEDAAYVEKISYHKIISEYGERVENFKSEQGLSSESMVELRYEAMKWQESCAKILAAKGAFSNEVVEKFIDKNQRIRDRIKRHSGLTWTFNQYKRKIVVGTLSFLKSIGLQFNPKTNETAEIKELQIKCYQYVISQLSSISMNPKSPYKAEDAATLLVDYQRSLGEIQAKAPSVTQFIQSNDLAERLRMKALRYEQEFVNDAYSDGLLDRQSANDLRRQIAAMQLDVFNEI